MASLALTAVAAVFLLSCERIGDDNDDCGIYLEFVYDYNMEYADSFDPHVGMVDVFVFDAQQQYLFTKSSRREELDRQKRMFLGGDLAFGRYHMLTVGGLAGGFRVTDKDGGQLAPGKTQLDDVRIELVRDDDVVDHEFEPLWVGTTIQVDYKADLSVHRVNLIKNTNRFNMVLVRSGTRQVAADAPYTFRIETPEAAVYGHDNTPRTTDALAFEPYSLAPGSIPDELSVGWLNTARLLYGAGKYRIVVRNTQSGRQVWKYDLMTLLENAKPLKGVTGQPLQMQEFLDRQSEWHFVIVYKENSGEDGFVAVSVEINDWIIWLNEIGV
jgi:hypothetical protein